MEKKQTTQMGIDSTKTGPLGLRGLPGIRREGVLDTYQAARAGDLNAMAIMLAINSRPSDFTDWKGYWEPSPAPEAEGLGESVYDSPIMIDPSAEKIQNARAEELSAALKWINGISKGFLTVGTTFIDGTVGLVFGLANMAVTGKFSNLWDNPITRAMLAVTDWSEKALPNYRTVEEQEAPFWENFGTANFWADTVVKNFGYLVGAYFSGGIITKPISMLGKGVYAAAKARNAGYNTLKQITKASRAVNKITHAGLSAVAEGSVEAINNSRDWFNLHKELIDNYYINALALAKELYGEGTPEYLLAANDIASAYKNSLEKLENDRQDMGNADLQMNIPILMASNLVLFGRFLGNGFKSSRKFAGINGITGDWGAFKAVTTNKKAYLSGVKSVLSEGTEEMSLKIASDFAGNYLSALVINSTIDNFRRAKYDTGAKKETVDMITAFSKALSSNLTDPKSWEEFFVGALYGALGMPSIRKAKTAEGKFLSPITLNGGFIGEVRHQQELMRREQELANYMNKRANDSLFKLYYEGMIRNRFYQKKMDLEAADGKQKEFKDDLLNQLISDVVMFDRAGKLDILKSHIEEMNALDDNDIDEIILGTTKEFNTRQLRESISLQIESLTRNQGLIEERKQELQDELNEIRKLLSDARLNNDLETIKYLEDKFDETYNELLLYKRKSSVIKENGYYYNLYLQLSKQIKALQQKLDSLLDEDSTKEFGGFYNAINQPMSREEIKEKVKKNAKEVSRMLDVYREFMDRVELEYGDNFTNELLETLVWLRGRIDGGTRRSKDLYLELKNRKNKAIQTYKDEEKAFQESLTKLREELGDKFDENSKENRETRKKLEDTKKNIDLVEELYTELEKRRNENIEDGLTSARDIYANHKYVKPLIELLGDSLSNDYEDFEPEFIEELIKANLENREPNLDYIGSLESELLKLIDIIRLANDVNTFYKKLNEYLTSPEKLTADLNKGKLEESLEKLDESVKNIASLIKKATSSKEVLDVLEENKTAIDNLGGKDVLLLKLPVTLKDKVEKALSGTKVADSIITKTGVDSDSDVGSVITQFVKNAVDSSENLLVKSIIDLLQDTDKINKIATALTGDEVSGLELAKEAIEALGKVDSTDIESILDEITHRNIEEEAAKREQELFNQASKMSDKEAKELEEEEKHKVPPTDAEKNEDDKILSIPNVEGEVKDNEKVVIKAEESNNNKEKELDILYNNTNTPSDKELKNLDDKGYNKRDNKPEVIEDPNATHDPTYGNRPLISLAYFHRKPSDLLETYADHIKEKGCPKWVPINLREEYLDYITEITKYLLDKGVFEYIRGGNLKIGDKLIIGVDPTLNEKCHTVVPLLIKITKNEDGTQTLQVVGSLKTDFEFIDENAKKNLKLLYDFYQLFKEETKGVTAPSLTSHTTTITTLLGGNIAFSDLERTLNEIHLRDTPIIGYSLLGDSQITVPNKSNTSVRVRDAVALAETPFRLYTMVKCHNNVFLPAVVRSKKLSDLLEDSTDWYILLTIKSILELTASPTPSAIEEASKKVKKWLYLPGGVYSHFVNKNGIHYLRYSWINTESGEREYRQIRLNNNEVSELNALDLIKGVLGLFPDTYISVDLLKINSDLEYSKNMANYLTANLIIGGNKSINDFFLFAPIDKKPEEKEPPKPSKDNGTLVKVDDTPVIVDNKGDVTDLDGKQLDADTQQKAQEEAAKTLNNTKTSILGNITGIMGRRILTPTSTGTTSTTSNNKPTSRRQNATLDRINRNRHRHRLVEESPNKSYPRWNKKEELAWLNKVLPQLTTLERVKLVEGLINAGSHGEKAWGLFDGAMVTLSELAAKGTTYHEAFHVVFNLLLTSEERQSLLDEYREKHPDMDNLSLEEELAEDFREFVENGGKDTRSLGRKIIDFFKSLFIKTKYWKNFRPSSTYYFRKINEGGYANIRYRKSSLIDIDKIKVSESKDKIALEEKIDETCN